MIAASARPAGIRLVAVALFIGGSALLAALTILNLVAIGEARQTVAERNAQLSSLQRRLDAPAADGRPLDTSSIYVAGASRSLASAKLQQHLVAAIGAGSGRLIETSDIDTAVDPTADADPGAQDGIRLRATLDIDNDGLLQLLFALESGVPLLDVEAISIRRAGGATDSASADLLRVEMTVRAHWKPDPVG